MTSSRNTPETPDTPPAAGETATDSTDPATDPELLEILRTGELTILGRIPSASNATLVCDAIAGEESVRCVYKPVRGEVPLWDFPDGTLAGREVASYLISETLGWGTIPATVHRAGPLGEGMVQRWVETPDNTDHPVPEIPTRMDLVDLCPPETLPDGFFPVLRAFDPYGDPVVLVHADDPRLQRVAVLDVVLNNADRKGGHVLEGLDGGVYGIDHGICLHEDDKLRTVLWGWAGRPVPGHLVADIADLAERLETAGSDLREGLARHITPDEVDALTIRAIVLAETATMPRPPEHRPVPWPPF